MNKTQISKLQSEFEIFFFILSVLHTFEKKSSLTIILLVYDMKTSIYKKNSKMM